MKRRRLIIVATHPIQYQVPWFAALSKVADLDLTIYFATLPDAKQQGTGFGIPFQWDIPMLEGYAWKVIANSRRRPDLGRFFGSSTPDVYSLLKIDRPDAVIITGWNALPLLQGLLACIRLRIPRIVRGESNALRARPVWASALHRSLLKQYDAVLAIGRANRAFYLSNGVPDERIFSTPYFVDNDRFARAAGEHVGERSALRQRWGIPERAVCFLFAGKLDPKKRVLDLIRAMEFVESSDRPVHLLIVGEGAQLQAARAMAAAKQIAVSFTGFLNQTEMPLAYVVGDCLVLPSDYGETWGLVVNEAMACGLPAVVSDRVGCGPDLVEHRLTGLLFPFGDVAALGEALRSLATRPSELEQMGARARERVAAYSVQEAVAGTLEAVRFATHRP